MSYLRRMRLFVSVLLLSLLAACGGGPSPLLESSGGPAGTISVVTVDTLDGRPIHHYTLTNDSLVVQLINYGGIITHLFAPDRNGARADVVLGFDDPRQYQFKNPYFGAIIGRYGNRIAGGRFTLDGKVYTLATNNGPNALHGGVDGFNRRLWRADTFQRGDTLGVHLDYRSSNTEEGYPGNLLARVTYGLVGSELVIGYRATTDAPTPVNLTNHTYFNLSGQPGTTVLDHEIRIRASHYTPVDSTLIPTGEIAPVAGTPFDFTRPKTIGKDIGQDHEQLRFGGGYDHNFVLDRSGPGLMEVATVHEPNSGRTLTVLTQEPGVQFYTGNFLDGTLVGKGGQVYGHRTGFCLETQHFPDSPNHPNFPTTILRPGQTYSTKTVYRFASR